MDHSLLWPAAVFAAIALASLTFWTLSARRSAPGVRGGQGNDALEVRDAAAGCAAAAVVLVVLVLAGYLIRAFGAR